MTRTHKLLLGLILVSATLLRVPRLIHIYPTTAEWDEMFLTENAEELGIRHQLRPRWVYYPGMCYYPHALALAVARGMSDWHQEARGAALWNLHGPYRRHQDVLDVCRVTQGILGVITVLLTFVVGRRLYSTSVGLWASLLLAWMPFDVIRSQVIKPGAPAALWCVVALIGADRVRRHPTLRNALIAGFLVGLPVAARYNAAPAIAFPLGIALMTSVLPRARALAYLAAAGLMSLLAFFVTNPYFLIAPEWYFDRIGYMMNGYAVNSLTRGLGTGGIIWMVFRSLPSGWLLGWLSGTLFLVTLAPMSVDIARGARRWLRFSPLAQTHLMVLSFAIGFPLVHCLQNDVWLPHILHLIFPFAALVAAHGLDRFLDWIDGSTSLRMQALGRPVVWTVVALLLVHGPSVVYRHSGTKTTRAAAVGWAYEHKGDALALTVGIEPPPSRGWVTLDRIAGAGEHLLDATRYVVVPHAVGRRIAQSTEDSPARELLFHPRLQLNGRVEPRWPTYYGDSVAVFRVEPSEADLTIARVSLASTGVWSMLGEPVEGRMQSDGRWTVDPFLTDLGASTVSVQFADVLPFVSGGLLTVTVEVFCRSPKCDPSLQVSIGERSYELAVRCDQSWQSLVIDDLAWDELQDDWLSIEPTEGPEILMLGALELTLSKPMRDASIVDAAVAGTLAAHQLGSD